MKLLQDFHGKFRNNCGKLNWDDSNFQDVNGNFKKLLDISKIFIENLKIIAEN